MGRGNILILLTPSTSLNPEAAHTSRYASVLRDTPCGRANAELLFPFIQAADISHHLTDRILKEDAKSPEHESPAVKQ